MRINIEGFHRFEKEFTFRKYRGFFLCVSSTRQCFELSNCEPSRRRICVFRFACSFLVVSRVQDYVSAVRVLFSRMLIFSKTYSKTLTVFCFVETMKVEYELDMFYVTLLVYA